MILVDTSIWISFFRQKEPEVRRSMTRLLDDGQVMALSVVFGELLQGTKNDREANLIMEFWASLPKPDETGLFIEAGKLSKEFSLLTKGVGLLDSYILAACRRHRLGLWSLDGKLNKAFKMV